MLIDAIAQMRNRSKVTLLALGDGVLRPDMEAAIARHGIKSILPGFINQSQLGRYFRAADVFVLPSVFESWGLVVNEALLFDLPCICSTGVGGAIDLIDEGRTGWTFPSGDQAQLTRLLDQAFELGNSGREAMKPAIREKIARYSPRPAAEGIRNAVVAVTRGALARKK
jgi:glycosyltransferase involved in cell wall biosynthesis